MSMVFFKGETMLLFNERILKDSIKINATPEKVWNFFTNIEKNYKSWHPDDHIVCKYIKGKPHEVGSIAYAEELIAGKLCKIKMVCTKIETNKRSEYRSLFPLSIFHPKSIYLFEKNESNTIFTAINHFRIPKLFGKRIETLIDATEKHIKEEGKLLKILLEKESYSSLDGKEK